MLHFTLGPVFRGVSPSGPVLTYFLKDEAKCMETWHVLWYTVRKNRTLRTAWMDFHEILYHRLLRENVQLCHFTFRSHILNDHFTWGHKRVSAGRSGQKSSLSMRSFYDVLVLLTSKSHAPITDFLPNFTKTRLLLLFQDRIGEATNIRCKQQRRYNTPSPPQHLFRILVTITGRAILAFDLCSRCDMI